MSELVDFLRARLDEDVAQWSTVQAYEVEMVGEGRRYPAEEIVQEPYLAYVDHFDPARVLREVEVKRRILDEHPATTGWDGDGTDQPICLTCSTSDTSGGLDGDPYPCRTLRLLALPHAAHKDYRTEWALQER